jgi:N-acetylmuramoyl-L-alanine amidase
MFNLVKKVKWLLLIAHLLHQAPLCAQYLKTLVIDAGHGGKDPGCHGDLYNEKDVALAVALRLGALIDSAFPQIKVIYTRNTDVFVALEDRAQIANRAKADLFISIHCNAAGKALTISDPKTGKQKIKYYTNKRGKRVPVETTNPIPYGSETYVMGLKNEDGKMQVASRENSVMLLEDQYEKTYQGFDPEKEESYIIMSNYTQAYVLQSAMLGKHIQEAYGNLAGRIDKGVHRQSIWVLWRTAMPSVLTEIGYLTNPKEECFLGHKNGQYRLAWAIFSGFCNYKNTLEPAPVKLNSTVSKIKNENLENINLCENWFVSESAVPTEIQRVDTVTPIAEVPKGTVYKIQIMSSTKKLSPNDAAFSGLQNVSYYELGGIYKYTCGSFKIKEEALIRLNEVKALGFSGAFLVVFKDGVRVPFEH